MAKAILTLGWLIEAQEKTKRENRGDRNPAAAGRRNAVDNARSLA